jgi:protein-tyrosine phosphatase
MSEIINNLYISSKNHVPFLVSNYDLIVNCTPDIPFPLMCKATIRIPVHDHPSYAQKMLRIIRDVHVLEAIHAHLQEGKTVLVHCRAGIQRSCAVVACYLVKYHGLTPDQAIAYIKAQRPIAFLTGVNFRETIEAQK